MNMKSTTIARCQFLVAAAVAGAAFGAPFAAVGWFEVSLIALA
jgi:hypothetical protein